MVLVTMPRLIDSAASSVNEFAVDPDDLFPAKPDDPLTQLAKQDLDPISLDELHVRIEALRAEIARVEAHIARAQSHRSAAEQLFKR